MSTTTALQDAFGFGNRDPMDRWLCFVSPIQARYDEENGERRIGELRGAIYFGLVTYNVYNITSVVLLPDVVLLSVMLRLGLVTPTSLALAWLIGRTRSSWAERLVTLGVVNAYFVPLFLFWISREPVSLYTFGELPLTIIFATMLLVLRFPNAILFTLCALLSTLLALATKSGLEPPIAFAFAVQITTACTFGLYANYRQERRRCLDYLRTLGARLEARSALTDSQIYRGLSRTDALTHLPNRRELSDRLEAWLREGQAVAVMMIDIDHFKLYNDALGHPEGDDCLRRVAATFALIASETDEAFCARFGGEEFTFVLRGRGEAEAARLAHTIVEAVKGLAIPHPARGDGVNIVTVSVGVARSDGDPPRPIEDLLAAADRSLYAAKRRGRGRFAFELAIDQPAQIGRRHAC